jgi:group I intron endonuclease
LTKTQIRTIKNKYAGISVIYLWYNKITGKTYVGGTVNLLRRLENYMASTYIIRTKEHMPICAALFKYGVSNFELYILETISQDYISNLVPREEFWVQNVNPSYNVAAVMDRFVGANHPRFGKSVSVEVRNKISDTLTGRKLSALHRENISNGQKKKAIYCYDYDTGYFVTEFVGIRPMCRLLRLSNITLVQRKLDNNKPFVVYYKGIKCTWRLTSRKTPTSPRATRGCLRQLA